MKQVRKYLQQKQAEFRKHTFFNLFLEDIFLDEFANIAQKMTFWVMSFQDIIQLNASRMSDPDLYKVACIHQAEDGGHQEWFLKDLSRIGCQEPSLRTVYSPEHAHVRSASYMLIAEVFNSNNDFERIALILTIESTSHVFFEQIASFHERIGNSSNLEYFSNHHLEAEEDHKFFDQKLAAIIDNIQLTLEQEKSICELIDRAYIAFITMFNDLASRPENKVEATV